MIYLCQNCGWRINQRYDNDIAEGIVGKHLLYNHKAFCSEYCIEKAKGNPHILNRNVIPSDWNEQGRGLNGIYGNWKTDRKINRQPRPKNRKL